MIRKVNLMMFLVLAAGSIWTLPIAAGLDPKIVDSFIAEGDRFYAKRDMPAALESYSRAFLLDPQRKDARDKLLSLTDASDLSGSQRASLHQLRGLMQALSHLSVKVDHYDGKLEEFIGELTRRGQDAGRIRREMEAIEREIRAVVPPTQARELFLGAADPLGMIIASVREKSAALEQAQEIRARQFERLRQLSRQPEPDDRAPIVLSSRDLERQPSLRSSWFIGEQQGPVKQRDRELVDLSLELTESHRSSDEKDRQIKSLQDQMQQLGEQLRFNERLIQEKNEELVALQQQAADLQAQLQLRQRIVQEKQQRIEVIEEERADGRLEEENEVLKEAMSELRRDNVKLERMLEISQEKIADLQRGISRQSHDGFRWFWEKEEQDQARQMDALTLNKYKNLVQERDQRIIQREEQIAELKGVVEIYRELLKEAKSSFITANQALHRLQDELAQVEDHLNQKNKLVLEAEYNLMSLKKDMAGVQARMAALRNLPETRNYVKIESEMHELEDKMDNIHKFLLKQLDDFERLNKEYVSGDIEDMDKVLNLNIDRIERK